jgi:hypothetical protein
MCSRELSLYPGWTHKKMALGWRAWGLNRVGAVMLREEVFQARLLNSAAYLVRFPVAGLPSSASWP